MPATVPLSVGHSLHRSIAVAIAAHASVILALQWGHTPALAVTTPPTPESAKQEKAPIAPQEPAPFAVEFVTLPEIARPSQPTQARTQRRAADLLQERGAAPKLIPSEAPTPSPYAQQLTRETPSPSGLLQPDKQPSAPASGSGFSLGMRRSQVPDFDGRQGSLLDDAIASAGPAPTAAPGPRTDLIRTEARIGLDSQSTRVTRWQEGPDGSFEAVGEPFAARIDSDGSIHFKDHDNFKTNMPSVNGVPIPIFTEARFDLTDAAMAAFGDVLYPYRKLKAMDQTREHRAAMSVRARGESLQAALTRFDRDLKKVWRNTSLPAADRRAIIFALWDECAEKGPEEVVETAASIRAIIVSFVVRELPQQSADAFGANELSKLNADRQSTLRFTPYDK